MNTLQDLNGYQSTGIPYTDLRPADVIFDRATGTNQSVEIYQHQSLISPVGVQVKEVIDAATCIPYYEINLSSFPNASVTWTNPNGLTTTNPSTGVYRIYFNTAAEWAIISQSFIIINPSFVGPATYTASVKHSGTKFRTWTVSLNVIPAINFTNPTDFYFESSSSGSVTGVPTIVDEYENNWSITVTPSSTSAITTLATAGTGGTVSFNNTSKVLSISGTRTQVLSHLNSISYIVPSTSKSDFSLIYYSYNSDTLAVDTKLQNWYSLEYFSRTRSPDTYQTSTITNNITGGPLITDNSYSGTGDYEIAISAYPNTGISNMSSIGYSDYRSLQTILNPDPDNNDNWSNGDMVFSKNGDYYVVSNDLDNFAVNPYYQGSVNVFKKSNGTYNLHYTFLAENTTDILGRNPNISDDGNTLSFGVTGTTNEVRIYSQSLSYNNVSPVTFTDAYFTIQRTVDYKYLVTKTYSGSGYAVNDTITILGGLVGGNIPTNNIVITVTEVSAFGEILSFTHTGTSVGGTTTYTNIHGSSPIKGVGATFNVSKDSTNAYVVTLSAAGTGYKEGDIVSIRGTTLGGFVDTNKLLITVTSVDGTGGITDFTYSGTAEKWSLMKKIISGDGKSKLSGDASTIFISSGASVAVYVRSGNSWDLQHTMSSVNTSALTHPLNTTTNGNILTISNPEALGLGTVTARNASTIAYSGSVTPISTSTKKYGSGSFQFTSTIGQTLTATFGLTSEFPYTDSITLGSNQSVTIEAWVYRTRLAVNEILFNAGDFTLSYTSSNTLRFTYKSTVVIDYSTTVTNQWKHIVISWGQYESRLYIDGVKVATNTSISLVNGYGGTLLRIGGESDTSTTNKFVGFMDDVRVTFTKKSTQGIYGSSFTPPTEALGNLRASYQETTSDSTRHITRVLLNADGAYTDNTTPPYTTEYNVVNAGNVQSWIRSGTTWTQMTTLALSNPTSDQQFGSNSFLFADGSKLYVKYGYGKNGNIYNFVANQWVLASSTTNMPSFMSDDGLVYITYESSSPVIHWSYNGQTLSKTLGNDIESTSTMQYTRLSPDGSAYCFSNPTYSPSYGAVEIGKLYTDIGWTYDSLNNILTMYGSKSNLNRMVDQINMTFVFGYVEPILLTYDLTTPESHTATRIQQITYLP